ncbi:hypothetical protein D3C71_2184720 [compost metagenome]
MLAAGIEIHGHDIVAELEDAHQQAELVAVPREFEVIEGNGHGQISSTRRADFARLTQVIMQELARFSLSLR